jgi:hypothetical protein
MVAVSLEAEVIRQLRAVAVAQVLSACSFGNFDGHLSLSGECSCDRDELILTRNAMVWLAAARDHCVTWGADGLLTRGGR